MTATVKDFFKRFPTDAACLEHVFNARFGQGHACPKCKRSAKWYPLAEVRAYSCQWCGHHIHPTAGTLFQDSRTSLQSWFYAVYLFTVTRHGVSAKELQRQLGVTYKTAWRMGHEVRKHMDRVRGDGPLSGEVEMDEAMFGGVRKGAYGGRGKTVVLGMASRSGDLVARVVADRKHRSILPVIAEHVSAGSTIYTDYHPVYEAVKGMGHAHNRVNHSAGEYVKGPVHVNTVECYWLHLKQSIRGTHVHVSPKHLEKYASEFAYRFSRRKAPGAMLPELLSAFPS